VGQHGRAGDGGNPFPGMARYTARAVARMTAAAQPTTVRTLWRGQISRRPHDVPCCSPDAGNTCGTRRDGPKIRMFIISIQSKRAD
jgi:hypothetical protein